MRNIVRACGFLCAFLAAAALAAAEKASSTPDGPRAPKDPVSLTVEPVDPKDAGRKTDLSATIVTARGDKRTGTLTVKPAAIEVSVNEGGSLKKMSVTIADIDSIEITRWRAVERRKNEFAFYPAEMKIVLRDNRSLLCSGGAVFLNRLSFRDGGGARFLYAYFYDYWKNGAWKNSKQADKSYPETNPIGDTLVKIIFLREEMKNPLEKLLSR